MMRAFLLLCLFVVSACDKPPEGPHAITTPAGISVWVIPDNTTPTLTISFAFRGGTEEDPSAQQGRAALMTALLTEGTSDLTATEFSQQLNDHNISLGFSAAREAITGQLRFLLRYQPEAVALTRGALYDPAFRTVDIERIKQTTLAELKRGSGNPAWRVQRLFTQQVFAGTPYANAARGTPTTIPTLDSVAVTTAKQHHLTRARLVMVATGAADDEAMADAIDAIFADLPAGTPWQPTKLTAANSGTVWYSPWPEGTQNQILFTAPSVPSTDTDYTAAMVLNDMLGGSGFSARLMDELRQNLGITYGASTSLSDLKALALAVGQTSVTATRSDEAMAAITRVRTGIASAITPARLADTVAHLTGSLTSGLVSSTAIADFYLNLRLANLPIDYAQTLPTELQKLDEKTLQRVAERLYAEAPVSFVVVGPVAPTAADRTITDVWTLE